MATRCVECQEIFTAPDARTKVCSDTCRRTRARARYTPKARVAVTCQDCKAEYRSTRGNRGVCRRCQKRRRGRNHRERARALGVPYEPINRLQVFTRDLWRCGLCGQEVLRTEVAPHPRSPSLDHIVPMARGGGHTYDNVQLACFLCNSRKGAQLVGDGPI